MIISTSANGCYTAPTITLGLVMLCSGKSDVIPFSITIPFLSVVAGNLAFYWTWLQTIE